MNLCKRNGKTLYEEDVQVNFLFLLLRNNMDLVTLSRSVYSSLLPLLYDRDSSVEKKAHIHNLSTLIPKLQTFL